MFCITRNFAIDLVSNQPAASSHLAAAGHRAPLVIGFHEDVIVVSSGTAVHQPLRPK